MPRRGAASGARDISKQTNALLYRDNVPSEETAANARSVLRFIALKQGAHTDDLDLVLSALRLNVDDFTSVTDDICID